MSSNPRCQKGPHPCKVQGLDNRKDRLSVAHVNSSSNELDLVQEKQEELGASSPLTAFLSSLF